MSTTFSSLEILLRPIVFTRPVRLVDPPSWVSHIPFAFWLVDALRPRTIVELGTMSGNSFAAMAQAVQTLKMDTACYSVDTWKGDPHTGYYGDEIYEEWSAFHDFHFSAFSRLVRSTFDEALPQFAAGSVDLLHIDGLHTYEAVHHDFTTWLPKLSPNAVVLLHDTNERGRDFGVWRFWQELTQQYPGFEFLHGHGLGVAGVGRNLPPDVRWLLEQVARSHDETVAVRQFFDALGGAFNGLLREAALARVEAQLRAQLGADVAKQQGSVASRAHLEQELAAVRGRVTAVTAENESLRAALRQVNRRLENELRAASAEFESRVASLEGEIARSRIASDAVRSRLEGQRRAALADAEQAWRLLAGARRSRSWRLTWPLRAGMTLARELVHRATFWRPGGPHATPFLASLRRSVRGRMRAIRSAGLFDETFYLRLYPDVAEADLPPLVHYVLDGARERRQPHPLFDSAWYAECANVPADADPLAHYLAARPEARRAPHQLFDPRFYRDQHPEIGDAEPLRHFLQAGAAQGWDPHPLFDTSYYLERNPDVAADGMNPLLHFVSSGASEGRNPNPWFDTAFYLGSDATLRESGENPLVHYLRIGAAEGRWASPRFDTAYYLRANPDVASSGLNPLVHYALSGAAEGRRTVPPEAAPGDSDASANAYATLVAEVRDLEARRIQSVLPVPPDLVTVSPDRLALHARDVVLPAVSAPQVSIVVPVLNGLKLTLECLLSITRFTRGPSFEVIVVDNGSSDGSETVLPAIPHLGYVRHDHNTGFVRGCNSGAEAARGQYLVFLNNDTQVQAGWLEVMLETFSSYPGAGAIGPKVIFPDGRLQDAGSTVNVDCTSSLIGLLDDPDLPRFNCARQVDYVSGVCLMVPTERFRSLGGFADEFAPAYCEDVDLCLRLRQAGLAIVYQPSAVVVHHLSATSGELGSSFKIETVTRNQQVLSTRHQPAIDALNDTRIIAFYLPQFHPIPENDVWWGKGFTEWRNVTRARANFEGHYQPRLPGDLGFYDLRLPEAHAEQAALAARYGVTGFCYYYYWFDGKRLLERPLERLIHDGSTPFPFCVCWANENWTRRWDGLNHEILMAQSYRDDDDVAVIEDLVRFVRRPSYIRIDGRPLLLIYHASRFPDVRHTTEAWRSRCRDLGIGEIYIAMVESFDLSHAGKTPHDFGFDAAVEFPPHQAGLFPVEPGSVLNPNFRGRVFDYAKTALHYMTQPVPPYRRFRTVMPSWDNTARRQDDPVTFAGSTPGAYQAWLEHVLRQTREQNFGDERIVFVNAWNEWAEGTYLEPDLGWGHGYLEATRDAVDNVRLNLWRHG